jgi:hypothetical protein
MPKPTTSAQEAAFSNQPASFNCRLYQPPLESPLQTTNLISTTSHQAVFDGHQCSTCLVCLSGKGETTKQRKTIETVPFQKNRKPPKTPGGRKTRANNPGRSKQPGNPDATFLRASYRFWVIDRREEGSSGLHFILRASPRFWMLTQIAATTPPTASGGKSSRILLEQLDGTTDHHWKSVGFQISITGRRILDQEPTF